MTGIIDIHTHILPGIDDGSRDWDESRRMLEAAYQQGTRCIIATPHYSRRGLPPQIYELAERLSEEAGRIAPSTKSLVSLNFSYAILLYSIFVCMHSISRQFVILISFICFLCVFS